MQERERKGNSLYLGSLGTTGEITKHKEVRIEGRSERGGMI
jgi:hypothetical protein